MADFQDYSPNAFSRAMNPDNQGTLFGTIGRMTGQMGAEERAGGAAGQALRTLSELKQQGHSPQQSVIKLLQRPEGQQLFMNDPKASEKIQSWITQVTPPEPALTKVNPGDALYSTINGKTTQVGSQPTERSQTFRDLTGIVNMDANTPEMKDLVNAQLGGDKFQEAQAVRRMVRAGTIAPETGDKLLSGAYKKVSILNDLGQPIGEQYIDITTGQPVSAASGSAPSPAGGQPSTGGTPAGGTPHTSVAPDLRKMISDPKESMALGTGTPAIASSYIGSVIRQVDPGYDDPNSELNSRRRESIGRLKAAIVNLPDINGRLKSVIDTMAGLVPSYGPLQDPVDSVNKLIDLRTMTQQHLDQDNQTYYDTRLPKEIRIDAGKSRIGWQGVMDALPSQQALTMQAAALKNREPGVGNTPASVVKDAAGAAPSLVQGTKSLIGAGADVAKGTPKPTATAPQAPQAPAPNASAPAPAAAAPVTPQQLQAISTMAQPELLKLNVDAMPPDMKAAVAARVKELIAQGQSAAKTQAPAQPTPKGKVKIEVHSGD